MNKEKQKPALSGVERVVPELRFPEFENDGDWKQSVFDDLIQIIDGDRGVNYPKQDDFSSDGYCLFLNAKNVTKQGFVFDKVQFINKEKDETLRNGKLKRLDILLTTRGSVGQFAYYSNEVVFEHLRINSGMVILRIKDDKILSDFFYKYCFSNIIKSEIKDLEFGNAQKQLTVSIIKKLPLVFSKNPKEQQKIANCLSSLDNVITAETEKLAHLKNHKKGLLQQLFPAKGDALSGVEVRNKPQFRFPEFVGDGDWEEKKLDEICEVNPSNKNLPEEFVYIDLESVKSKKLLKKNIINRDGAPSRAQRLLKNEDVIFQMVRPYQKNNYFFKPEDNLEYVASTGYAQLRAFENKMYLFQYIHIDNFVNQVLDKCTGSNYPAINSGGLSKIKVEIPKPKEQQKIANCLSSADDLIQSQTKKIETLKAHKKGLMQQLFPNIT